MPPDGAIITIIHDNDTERWCNKILLYIYDVAWVTESVWHQTRSADFMKKE